jgi:plasmid stabilization system protein ParE
MTKREAAQRATKVKVVLRALGYRSGEGAFEELLETPSDGIRYRRAIAGHFKIIYRVVDGVVHVSDIFDSRQDPARMQG